MTTVRRIKRAFPLCMAVALLLTGAVGCAAKPKKVNTVSNAVAAADPIQLVSDQKTLYSTLYLETGTVADSVADPVSTRVSGEAQSIIVTGNANVTSSSSWDAAGFSMDFVYDGDTTAASGIGWSSVPAADAGASAWLSIDYKRLNFINRVDLYPRADAGHVGECFPQTLKIEVSRDGVDWKTVSYVTGYPTPTSGQPVVIRFSTQLSQYIRITGADLRKGGSGSGYAMQLGEVMAYYQDYKPAATQKAKAGAIYYVSASKGSDSNDGLSPATPFQTLAKASSLLYTAGNTILFQRGDVWQNQCFTPDGSGTKDSPIAIGAYGSGARPVFKAGNAGGSGIKLMDQSYIRISGLEFSNSIFGVLAVADETSDNRGLYISDCYFHDMTAPYEPDSSYFLMPYPEAYFAAGINICVFGNAELKNSTYYSDIQIDGCNFDRTDTGILNTLNDYPMDLGGYPTTGHTHFTTASMTDVHVSNVHISKSYRSGGIMLYGCKNSSVDNAFITQTGYQKGMFWGVCACQISMCENFVIKNSEFCFTQLPEGSVDGEGVDFESGNVNCTLYNTYIHDCEGPSILIYGGNAGWRGSNTGITIDSCILENNARKNKFGVFNYYTGNGGVVKNTTVKLLMNEQTLAYNGMAFDELFTFDTSNRIFDAAGNLKQGSLGIDVSDDAGLAYSGGWSVSNGAHVSTGAGEATFRFYGTSVSLLGSLAGGASGTVYIDGLDSGTLQADGAAVFTKTGLSKGTHVVRVAANGAGVTLGGLSVEGGSAT